MMHPSLFTTPRALLCAAALLVAAPGVRAAEADEGHGAVTVHVLSAEYLKAEARPSSSTAAQEPAAYVRAAAMRTLFIAQLAGLAERRSRNEDVASFGERLGARHAAWGEQLSALAGSRKIQIPNELTEAEIAAVDHLTEIVVLDFDQDFLWHTIRLLRRGVEQTAAQTSSSDAEVAAFAKAALPELRQELAEAVKLGEALLKSGEAGYSKSRDYDDPNAGRESVRPKTIVIEKEGQADEADEPAESDTPTTVPAVKL